MIVRLGKTLLALCILLVGVQEQRNMWAQTHNVSSVILTSLILAVPVLLLLWSAYRKRETTEQPSKGWRTFWTVMATLSTLSLGSLLLALLKPPGEIIIMNGVQVPLGSCITGSKDMFKQRKEAVAFCTCLAEKLTNEPEVRSRYRNDLEMGRLDAVVERLKAEGRDVSAYGACITGDPDAQWTEKMIESIRENCRTEMAVRGLTLTDAERFCDCLTSKAAMHPPSYFSADSLGQAHRDSLQQACMKGI